MMQTSKRVRSKPSEDATPTTDVAIVGAGLAGLCAAERLTAEGYSVVVIEGRDRVGGRTFTGNVAGVDVDLGGTWVSTQHTAICDLAKRMGCSTVNQYNIGRNVLWLDGKRRTYKGTIPPISPRIMVDLARLESAVKKLVATIDVHEPWHSPGAAELDAISFGEWLDRKHASAGARAMMAVVSKVQWGCSPADVSLLHVLRYIRAAGGLDHMLDVTNGANEYRIAETTQEVAKRIAAHLDTVILGSPARRITQDEHGVVVESELATVTAQYAIAAMPPQHRGSIQFQPELNSVGAGLVRTFPMGALSKACVAYDRPFWRADGLTGEALTDTGTAFITFDVSPSDDGPGIMIVFCSPPAFDGFDPQLRQRRVTEQLIDLFGEQAAEPIDYIDHCWGADAFAPGGPHPAAGPFATTSYGEALREPHGRVHWAGTETAGMWTGTMNGAVLTGVRAAERIASLIGYAVQ